MSKQTIDLINKFMGEQGSPDFTYKNWNELMPVLVKIARHTGHDIFIHWYNSDCSITIDKQTLERDEMVSYGGYIPDEKNIRLAINEFLTKHYKWTQ